MRTKPYVTISTDDVKFLVYHYLSPNRFDDNGDDDALLDAKEYVRSLPYEDQAIFVLRLEGIDARSIGYFLNRSHHFVLSHYHKMLKQCSSLPISY